MCALGRRSFNSANRAAIAKQRLADLGGDVLALSPAVFSKLIANSMQIVINWLLRSLIA
jgi:hypothetical protein